MGSSLNENPFLGSFIRVPYCIGDPRADPNSDQPHIILPKVSLLRPGCGQGNRGVARQNTRMRRGCYGLVLTGPKGPQIGLNCSIFHTLPGARINIRHASTAMHPWTLFNPQARVHTFRFQFPYLLDPLLSFHWTCYVCTVPKIPRV